ncbi:L-lysine 6-transaminase [Balamuthia mandrillaris]
MQHQAAPLTREQVKRIQPSQVHDVLRRRLLVDGFDMVYDLDKSHGVYLHDSRTGKEYLDFFSFFASWPISHNHPKMQDPEFLKQISKVALHNPANSDIYTVEMAQFVATFERVAMPPQFKHLFLVQGGTLAVENALKAAFDWKVRLNFAKGIKEERGKRVIHFKQAFHGRGGYTVSLTNTSDPRKWLYFPRFEDWPRVHNPKAIFPLEGENLRRTIQEEEKSLSEIRDILDKQGADIACILLEPIQGEGGDNHFRPEYWQALRQLADQYDVLLIADEVQCGMGLTGKFWAYQHLGAVPDIITFGKKSQVCGIMTTERIDRVPDNVFKVSSRINSTWGGNLVDMVRSRRFLEIIEEEDLVGNSARVGAHLLQGLLALQKQFPQLVNNTRGKGLLCSFDLASPQVCSEVIGYAYEKGILLISCGTQTIRFRPVLDSKKEDIDTALAVLKEALSAQTSKAQRAAL